jgi:hypothetical protein
MVGVSKQWYKIAWYERMTVRIKQELALGIYRKEDDLKEEDPDTPGRAAKKVKPELIVKRELLRVLPLGALSFVL